MRGESNTARAASGRPRSETRATVIWNRLAALDVETATASEVAAIIGNDGWTSLKCNQCGRYVEAVVELGEPPGYESHTADICFDCVRLAFALLSPEIPSVSSPDGVTKK